MSHDFDTNHHFTGTQQADYNSLKANGRTLYDTKRWYQGYSHEEAFEIAKSEHGLKPASTKLEQDKNRLEVDLEMLRAGIDPRITW